MSERLTWRDPNGANGGFLWSDGSLGHDISLETMELRIYILHSLAKVITILGSAYIFDV